jgi:hypothetical protein
LIVIANLLTDIAYTWLDPRVMYSCGGGAPFRRPAQPMFIPVSAAPRLPFWAGPPYT